MVILHAPLAPKVEMCNTPKPLINSAKQSESPLQPIPRQFHNPQKKQWRVGKNPAHINQRGMEEFSPSLQKNIQQWSTMKSGQEGKLGEKARLSWAGMGLLLKPCQPCPPAQRDGLSSVLFLSSLEAKVASSNKALPATGGARVCVWILLILYSVKFFQY